MNHLPNLISLLRIPLAFAFFQPDPLLRFLALFCAGTTDWLDGFLARRYKLQSRLGTTIDPISDKFFVGCALFVFYTESRITSLEVFCMLGRDFALILFGVYLLASKRYKHFVFQSFFSGKAATTIQLFVILLLTIGIHVPVWIYATLALLGISSLLELFMIDRRQITES
jgi:CDP-diacylglycerol--glycerol-3-phosphate 3-phosphatidyltransferase